MQADGSRVEFRLRIAAAFACGRARASIAHFDPERRLAQNIAPQRAPDSILANPLC
jgi:hypothetical protein